MPATNPLNSNPITVHIDTGIGNASHLVEPWFPEFRVSRSSGETQWPPGPDEIGTEEICFSSVRKREICAYS
jgi:hypothetical protein